MCKEPVVIVLASDLTLESLPDGSPAVYWIPGSLQGKFLGGRGIRFRGTVFEIAPNTSVEVIGQWSVDGKTWVDYKRGIDNYGGAINAVGTYKNVYASAPEEFAPFVRLGIRVKATSGTSMVYVRWSAFATILFGDVSTTWGLTTSASLTAQASPTTIPGTSFDGSNFDSMQLFFTYSGNPTNLKFQVWSSGDGTSYAKIAETAALSGTSSDAVHLRLDANQLSPYLIIKYTMDSGSGITGSVQALGRNE